MASWSDIKQAFIDWAKANNREDIDENKNASKQALMQSDAFKLFIDEYDDDYGMDSFTSSKESITENRESKKNSLIEDMAEDYLSDLDKKSEAFKLIDEDCNGKLSKSEKQAFIDKVVEAGFDKNKEDFSYSDLQTAASKIESGDLGFLKGTQSSGGGGGTTRLNNQTDNDGDKNPKIEIPTTVEEAFAMETLSAGNYAPATAKAWDDITIEAVDIRADLLNTDADSLAETSLNDLDARANIITGEIASVQTSFAGYKDIYANATVSMQGASKYITQNNAQYNLIISEITANNTAAQVAQAQVQDYEALIDTTSNTIVALCATKDETETALNSTSAAISALEGQLYHLEDTGMVDSDGNPIMEEVKNPDVAAQIEALRAEEDELQAQLSLIAQQLLECQEALNKANEELTNAYQILEDAIEAVYASDKSKREVALAVLNNKQVYYQSKSDMLAAQAAMVAADAYIEALQAELKTIEQVTGKEYESKDTDNSPIKYTSTDENGNSQELEIPLANIVGLKENEPKEPAVSNIATEGEGENSRVVNWTYSTEQGDVQVTYDIENQTYKYLFTYSNEIITSSNDTMTYGNFGENEFYKQERNTTTFDYGQGQITTITMGDASIKEIINQQIDGTITHKFNDEGQLTSRSITDAENNELRRTEYEGGVKVKITETSTITNTTTGENLKQVTTTEKLGEADDSGVVIYQSSTIYEITNDNSEQKIADIYCNKQADGSWKYTYCGNAEYKEEININSGEVSDSSARGILDNAFAAINSISESEQTFIEFSTDGKTYIATKQEDGSWTVENK